MNKYLVNYRYTYETVEEVAVILRVEFKDISVFNTGSGVYFLISTKMNQVTLEDWVEKNLPYNLRDVTLESAS